MRARLRLFLLLVGLGALLMLVIPAPAFAHENIGGGDELAVSNWMLVFAFVITVTALLGGLWAFRAGQLTNIEDSKFSMLELSEDYDAIMAEADRHELAAVAAADQADTARAEETAPVRQPATDRPVHA